MPTLDFESDVFLTLLTDALRAGPGSPEWHEAVATLRGNGADETNEFQLLLAARENLEKGREYRSVRAGAGFARNLNEALDTQSASTQKPTPTAGAVAILSAGLILGAAAVLLYLLFPAGSPTASLDRLANTYFVETVIERTFDTSIPPEFARIGSLEIEAQRGLRPIPDSNSGAVSDGGIIWTQTLPASQPMAIDAVLRVSRPSDQVIAAVFVSDDADAQEKRRTGGHEFVWLYQAGRAKVVLPGGKMEMQSALAGDPRGLINLRIAIERDAVIVTQQGKPIWSGLHGLDAHRPRTLGLRFIRVGGNEKAGDPAMAFVSLKVSKP